MSKTKVITFNQLRLFRSILPIFQPWSNIWNQTNMFCRRSKSNRKALWPLQSQSAHLVVWRRLRIQINWGPLGPQYTGKSVWGSQIKPSPRSAHCEEAAADTQTNQTQRIWMKKKIRYCVSKSAISAFNLKWSWFRCLIQSGLYKRLQAILPLTSSVSGLF